jgi:hypothetical protein
VLVTAFSTNDDFAARFGEDLSDLEMTRVDALLARLRHHQGTPPARRFRWSKTTDQPAAPVTTGFCFRSGLSFPSPP